MIAITGWAVAHRHEGAAPPAAPPTPAAALTALPRPLAFEANRGQWDGEALFRAAGRGGTAFVTRTGAVFALASDAPESAARRPGRLPARGGLATAQEPTHAAPRRDGAAFRMRVVGATGTARAEGLDELPGKANFFLGKDPGRWRTGVPTYAKAKVTGVLPGVDVAYYGREGQLEYDFVVAPGVDPGVVRLAFEGVESLAVNADGDLAVRVAGREVLQRRPQVYEDGPAGRRPLGAAYVLMPGNEVAFHVEGRDPARRVVIDPVIVYGKRLGASDVVATSGFVAVDGSGGVFLSGTTASADFPVSIGGGVPNGYIDGFVVKLNASGPVFSTYVGGSLEDEISAIAVDSAGNPYVTGNTLSDDFPTKPYQASFSSGGAANGFVAKLSGTGGALVYSTYLRNSSGDYPNGIAVDSAGSAHVGGISEVGGYSAFAAKLSPTGGTLVYFTWLGPTNGYDGPTVFEGGIAVDPAGNAYAVGTTCRAAEFSTTAGAFQRTPAASDFGDEGFVVKLKGDGSVAYSTLLGGSGSNSAYAVAVDATGCAYVLSRTGSTNFPTTHAIGTGGGGTFVTKLEPDGTRLVFSTELRGIGNANAIQVDGAGHVHVAGLTSSKDFPSTSALQPNYGGGASDAFVAKLSSDGTRLVYATYLGGSGNDQVRSMALDTAGAVYLAGHTNSPGFLVDPAQATTATRMDPFVLKLAGPTLRAVSPAIGDLAGGASVTLAGDQLASGATVTFGGVAATSVTWMDADTITAVAPAHAAGAVDVVVTNPDGAASKLVGAFTYAPAPKLAAVSPATGRAAGGAAATVTGSAFQAGATVSFGGTPANGVVFASATSLIAVAPPHAAGTVDVVVTNPDGLSATLPGAYTFVPAPTVTGIVPASGSITAGIMATVSGADFQAGAAVSVGGIAATQVTVASASSLTFTVPAHVAGAADVVVTNPDGQSATLAAAFTYLTPPSVAEVSPSSGPAPGGTRVTVTGAAFQPGATVSFGGEPATGVSVASATSLTAVAPAHAAGAADVVVTNPDGLAATLPGAFTFVPPPIITSVAPSSGSMAGGMVAAITGASFAGGAAVSVGGTAATNVTVASATSITFTVPAHVAGLADVVVTNPDGQTATLAGAFTYLTPPSLATVSPASGPTAGGTPVTVNGAAFQAGAAVSFGGTPATNVSVTSGTSLTAVAPPHAAGAVDVSVTNPDGLSTTLASAYTFVPPPAVTSVEPPTGTTAGGTLVTLTGTGFQRGATVSFGGAASGLVSVASGTRITASSPQRPPGPVDLVVTNPDGQTTTVWSGFSYVAGSAPAPTLVTAAPTAGPEAGGTRVTLTGTGFQSGMVVSFGGSLATDLRVDDATRFTVTAPAHAAGLVDVSVSNPDGQSATLPRSFAYYVAGAPAPTIAAVTPSAGVEGGGWKVTLTGTGFMPGAAIAFGGLAAADAAVASATELTATVPAHAKGAVDVVVTNPDGQAATLPGAVSYVGKPGSGCGCASSGASLDLLLGLAAAAAARLRRRPAPRRGGAEPLGRA